LFHFHSRDELDLIGGSKSSFLAVSLVKFWGDLNGGCGNLDDNDLSDGVVSFGEGKWFGSLVPQDDLDRASVVCIDDSPFYRYSFPG